MDGALQHDPASKGAKTRKTSAPSAPAKPHAIFQKCNLAKQGSSKALKSIKISTDKAEKDLKQVMEVKAKLLAKG